MEIQIYRNNILEQMVNIILNIDYSKNGKLLQNCILYWKRRLGIYTIFDIEHLHSSKWWFFFFHFTPFGSSVVLGSCD